MCACCIYIKLNYLRDVSMHPIIKFVINNFRKTFDKFYNLVMQVTIVRPLLMFIAAVLWTDNMYIPGYVSQLVILIGRDDRLSQLLVLVQLFVLLRRPFIKPLIRIL